MIKKWSPYLLLAEKYCVKKGWYKLDETNTHPIIEPEDMWQALIDIQEYEYKNRKGK